MASSREGAARRRKDMLTVAVGLAVLLVVQFVALGMTQRVFLLCASIVVGAIGWKVFPFEIPHEGKFWKLTGERAKEAAAVAGAPAAGVTLAVLVSLLQVHKMCTQSDTLDPCSSRRCLSGKRANSFPACLTDSVTGSVRRWGSGHTAKPKR